MSVQAALRVLDDRIVVVEADQAEHIVEPDRAAHVVDFDVLAAAVHAWVVEHGALPGLVIHVPAFAGWANLVRLLRHLGFVWTHRRRIGRIALATDSRLAGAGIRLAELVTAAEIKQFMYAAFEPAVVWSERSHLRATSHPTPARRHERCNA
jgi:hypothetical protein